MKLDILVFGAHPDDVELGCGGTVIKEIKAGKRVGVIDLTRGELGTRGTAETRTTETKLASEIMGVTIRENMDFKDGFFKDDEEHKLALIKKIRQYQPEIVITNAVSDRHPDHGRGAEITVDACVSLHRQQAGHPRSIYHYIQFNYLTPDVVVDISAEMKEKLQAVKAYSTQFFNPGSKESETIISSQGFLDSVSYRAQDLGRQANCEYAEGFLAHQMPKVDSLLDIK